MSTPRFVLHYAPRSRAARALWLMEESGAPFELAIHDLSKGSHKTPEYLAVNPDGKVPALVDRGDGSNGWPVTVTESAAICAYIADVVPDSNLAPAIGSPARAAYATWLVYCGAAIEPAFTDVAFPRATTPPASTIGWPPFDQVLARISRALAPATTDAPWLLGAQFSAADLMIGGMLDFLAKWGKVPAEDEPLQRYLTAIRGRPALQRAEAREAEILAANA